MHNWKCFMGAWLVITVWLSAECKDIAMARNGRHGVSYAQNFYI